MVVGCCVLSSSARVVYSSVKVLSSVSGLLWGVKLVVVLVLLTVLLVLVVEVDPKPETINPEFFWFPKP